MIPVDLNKIYMVVCASPEMFQDTKKVLLDHRANIFNCLEGTRSYFIEIEDEDVELLRINYPDLEIYKDCDIGLVQPV